MFASGVAHKKAAIAANALWGPGSRPQRAPAEDGSMNAMNKMKKKPKAKKETKMDSAPMEKK